MCDPKKQKGHPSDYHPSTLSGERRELRRRRGLPVQDGHKKRRKERERGGELRDLSAMAEKEEEGRQKRKGIYT